MQTTQTFDATAWAESEVAKMQARTGPTGAKPTRRQAIRYVDNVLVDGEFFELDNAEWREARAALRALQAEG